MRLVFPDDPVDDVDLDVDLNDSAHVTAALQRAYPWPDGQRWVRANMVVTVDGRAQAGDGLTEGISSVEDKLVFGHLRADCDVVLVGAGTVRAEGYRALRPASAWRDSRVAAGRLPAPCLAIASISLDFDLDSDPFTAPMGDKDVARPIILTTQQAPADRRERLAEVADIVICGSSHIDTQVMLDSLEERGLTRILCEGGPRLLTDLLTAAVIDELDLTISPLLLMRSTGGLLDGAASAGQRSGHALRLAHIIEAKSTLMLRYLIDKPAIPRL